MAVSKGPRFEPNRHRCYDAGGGSGREAAHPVPARRERGIAMTDRTILVVGTYDTKSPELAYMAERIRSLGGGVLTMDICVLGEPDSPVDYSKHDVAAAGGSSIRAAVEAGHENAAMQIMARGASALAADLYRQGKFHGAVILGGTMGTDAALDICRALPLGVPKYVVSTIAFSPLIPPDRLSADIQMILWAGGLYGLNSVCKATLSQAAGAVLGAARAAEAPAGDRPVVGMTSLGSGSMHYMKTLKPALEDRGYEVAIFHATGMGGMAFENIASRGGFCCVMDFTLVELGNLMMGSVVEAGEEPPAGRRPGRHSPDRRAGISQPRPHPDLAGRAAPVRGPALPHPQPADQVGAAQPGGAPGNRPRSRPAARAEQGAGAFHSAQPGHREMGQARIRSARPGGDGGLCRRTAEIRQGTRADDRARLPYQRRGICGCRAGDFRRLGRRRHDRVTPAAREKIEPHRRPQGGPGVGPIAGVGEGPG